MPSYDIEVRNRGGQVVRADADRFLLDELEAAGLSLPFGCRFGACLSCAVSVIEGHLDHSDGRSFALRDEQQATGYALPCVAKPRADCVIDVGVRKDMYINHFKDGRSARRLPAALRPPTSSASGQDTDGVS